MLREAFPDPVVSANIYCSDQLDSLIEEAIAPFWCSVRSVEDTAGCYLWFLRYDKAGEHLKIRLHGPPEQQSRMRRRLGETIEPFLSSLAGRTPVTRAKPPAMPWQSSAPPRIPPIDLEDTAEARPEDRSLLFTRYRRSPVSLGVEPFLSDERYLALLTRCLGGGCEEILRTAQDAQRGGLQGQRQTALLKLVIIALAGAEYEPAAYLRYHRDWLIRFPLLKSKASVEHGRGLLARFETFCARRSEQLDFLAKRADEVWVEGLVVDDSSQGARPTFKKSLVELLRYIASFVDQPEYHLDPYAADLAFPILFKVLHGLANGLGLNHFEEAFAYHLLLRAVVPESEGDVNLSLFPFGEIFNE